MSPPSSSIPHRRRLALKLAVAAAAVAATAFFFYSRLQSTAPPIEGVYLVKGGVSYVAIERRDDGLHDLKVGPVREDWTHYRLGPTKMLGGSLEDTEEWALRKSKNGLEWIARFRRDHDSMTGIMKADENGQSVHLKFSEHPELYDWRPVLFMNRSRERPGDFDLARLEFSGWEFLDPRYIDDLRIAFEPPIPSFLRRVDDNRILRAIEAMEREAWSAALALASAAADDEPGDLHLRGFQLDLALRAGDIALLRSGVDRSRAALLASTDPYLRRIPPAVDAEIAVRELDLAGENGWRVIEAMNAESASLADWIEGTLRLNEYDRALPGLESFDLDRRTFPDWLRPQLRGKTILVEAVFSMLAGDAGRAKLLLAGAFRAGSFNAEGIGAMHSMVGSSMETTAIGGLELYALNAAESPEELEDFAALLDSLDLGRPHPRIGDKRWAENPFLSRVNESMDAEHDRRLLVTRARFVLLRAAVAARHRLLWSGQWPESNESYAPLLDNGLPADPFGEGAIRTTRDMDDLILYSVGPDGDDSGARIIYDPTNGSDSAGDIILRVPRERRYPFPRGGVRAATAEEVQAIFPHGLPPDPFTFAPARPLNVSDTRPVTIWSFGPDNDRGTRLDENPLPLGSPFFPPHMKRTYGFTWGPPLDRLQLPPGSYEEGKPPGFIPEVQYDPTNGVQSEGDLIWIVPPP